jgi:hypothetical protein
MFTLRTTNPIIRSAVGASRTATRPSAVTTQANSAISRRIGTRSAETTAPKVQIQRTGTVSIGLARSWAHERKETELALVSAKIAEKRSVALSLVPSASKRVKAGQCANHRASLVHQTSTTSTATLGRVNLLGSGRRVPRLGCRMSVRRRARTAPKPSAVPELASSASRRRTFGRSASLFAPL